MADLCLPLCVGEDTFELHSVQLEAVERRIQTNRVCALSITITSYFCLNTAQYIVEYSDVNSDNQTLFYVLLLN